MTDTSDIIEPAPSVEQAIKALSDTPDRPIRARTRRAGAKAAASADGTGDTLAGTDNAVPGASLAAASAAGARAVPATAADIPETDAPSLDCALSALRAVSTDAKRRLMTVQGTAAPAFPGAQLSDLGPYVEHVMREAHGAAAAYQQEVEREASARAAAVVAVAVEQAAAVREDARAETQTLLVAAEHQAQAHLARKVTRIAELTGELTQMAELAVGKSSDGPLIVEQLRVFIGALTAAAERAVSDAAADTAAHGDSAR